MYFMLKKRAEVVQKSISCRQTKDDAARKKKLFSKMLLVFTGKAPYLSAKCFSNFNIV